MQNGAGTGALDDLHVASRGGSNRWQLGAVATGAGLVAVLSGYQGLNERGQWVAWLNRVQCVWSTVQEQAPERHV